jgi:glycerol-3-phosphate acyltransferase PlsX
MKIALDIMGGDYAPEATTLGAIAAQKEFSSDVQLVLIGDQHQIRSILERENVAQNQFEIVHTSEVIGMGEHPTRAFSKKPNASISVGFNLLKDKKVDAFASVGNTGAMLVGSMYSVKTIPGIIRPGITTILPKDTGDVGILLDVGTNADCKPDVLYQFAILGSAYANHVYKIKSPKVGLLNIGEEEEKGNLLTQATHALMKDSKEFNFIGNVEGRDLFNDKADVIVCDGFTGNIVLKEIEAFYTLIKKRGIKDDYFNRLNYELYGGTPILGINSAVVIGHGISNVTAIKNMLFLTRDVVHAKLPQKIKKAFN